MDNMPRGFHYGNSVVDLPGSSQEPGEHHHGTVLYKRPGIEWKLIKLDQKDKLKRRQYLSQGTTEVSVLQ